MKDKKKQKEKMGNASESRAAVGMKDMKQIMQDSRFAHVPFDRKLRHMPKEEHKVKLDSRFASMFTDEKFYEKANMDPRGRTGRFATKENLRKFYRMSDESESDDDDDDDDDDDSEDDEEKEETSSDEAESESKEAVKDTGDILERLKDLTQDYARGTNLFSDDSSDDDSSSDDDEEEQEFEWGELDQEAVWDTEQEVEETSRLALCNLDWTHIKAVDIMVMLNSFCPRGGSIKKVNIYPSEFGKQRMAEEDQFGPKELTSLDPVKKSSDFDDNTLDLDKLEKGKLSYSSEETKNFEALRRYERNRLKYYYAVVECDSVDTAVTVYKECDGQSFEMTGVNVDLRYIPNDMTFEEEVHDTCDTVPEFYESKLFMTTALLDSQPTLTWDQTDPHREKVLSNAIRSARAGKKYNEDYLIKNFIAAGSDEESDSVQEDDSSSDDDEDEEKDSKRKRIAKFRALMEEIDEKERKKEDRFNMESVFGIKADENDDKNGLDTSDEDDQEEEEEEKDLNPFEKFLEKKKNKRKEKKVKSRVKDSSDSEGNTFSDDDIPSDLKNDPFFAEEMKERGEEAKVKNKSKKKKKKKERKQKEEEEEENNEEKTNLELLLMDEDKEEKKHFSMRDIIDEHKGKSKKSKKKKKDKRRKEQEESKTDDFKVDTSDPRFSNLLTSGDYNIDPSHPQFKRTKAVDELINNVQKKRMAETFEEIPEPKRQHTMKGKEELELSMLVKKMKSKTKKPK